jgi:hypothetical protein
VHRVTLLLFATLSLLAPGCQKAEQIQSYNVPKEQKAERVAADAPAAKPGEPTDRMLAAILPTNGQAWFFKAVGPIPEIDKHEKEIKDFFSALTVGPDGKPAWKLPGGWKEEAGTGIRTATIVIPGDKRLEITVNTTPWAGTEDDMLRNVNRWLGQMQRPPIEAKQLPDVTQQAKAGDKPFTIVDLKGQFKSGGMTPPFAGGAFGPFATGAQGNAAAQPDGLPPRHPPIDSAPAASDGLPAGHPPIGAASPNAGPLPGVEAPAADVPKFTVAPSWKSIPAQGMRKAEFIVGDGAQPAHVTMFEFPANAGPMISDPLNNINRWRGEIGLSPLTKENLTGATQAIDVDGKPAIYAPMVPDASKPDESKANEATLAAIVKNDDQVWFVKMRGERELVKKHEDEFKSFLKSLKFSHDK